MTIDADLGGYSGALPRKSILDGVWLVLHRELHRPESNALTAPPTKHCFDRGLFNGLRAGKKSCRHREGKKGRNRHDGELAAGVRGDLMASFLRMSHYLVLCFWGPSYVSPAPPSRGT